MAPANSTCSAPFNSTITTDDITFPAANIFLYFIVVSMFATLTFSWHSRSLMNIIKEEYNEKYIETFVNKKHYGLHPWFHFSELHWMSFYIWPIITIGFIIAFVVWTWVEFSNCSNGHIDTPRGITGVVVTTVYGAWLIIHLLIVLNDIFFKRRVSMIVSDEIDPDPKLSKTLAEKIVIDLTSLGMSTKPYLATAQESETNKDKRIRFLGMNSSTLKKYRYAIFINNCIWGAGPAVLGTIAFMWDRSIHDAPFTFITNTQAGITGTNAILLTVTWMIHCGYQMKHMINYFKDGNTVQYHPHVNALTYQHAARTHIGLSADTFGRGMPLKGSIPYQYCPTMFILAKVAFAYSYGFLNNNDMIQATALFWNCGFLPIWLALWAGDLTLYITFDGCAWFFFFLFNYWMQAVAFPGTSESMVQMQLMSLNQSATYPGSAPSTEYWTSIAIVMYISFGLSLAAFFQACFSTPIPPVESVNIIGDGDENDLY